MSSAHSGCSSLRVNHSLGGRDSEAQGKRYAMMVSEPSSRMPPRTFSLRPLMTELTVITVAMPMTIPSMVSAERRGFLPSVSRASSSSSWNLSALSLRIGKGSGTRFCGRVLESVAMGCLFGSECFHRIELCSLGGWISAEEKPHAQRDRQAAEHRPKPHGAWQGCQPGNQPRDHHAQEHAQRAANHRNGGRFDKKLAQNVDPPRADGFAQADLPRALRHAHQHDVHDHDAPDHKRDRRDRDGDRDKRAADILPQGQERVTGLNREIVAGLVGQMMTPTHDLADLIHAGRNPGRRTGAHGYAQ